MSSRLFQEIREERGLAYTVFSSPSSYSDVGSLLHLRRHRARAGSASCSTSIDGVLDGMLADGITEEEHTVALGYLEGSMLLGLEDSGSAAWPGSARGLTTRDEVVPVDEHVARIRAVTTSRRAAGCCTGCSTGTRRRRRRRRARLGRRALLPWSAFASEVGSGSWD